MEEQKSLLAGDLSDRADIFHKIGSSVLQRAQKQRRSTCKTELKCFMEILTNGNADIAGLWKGTLVNNVTKCKFMCLVHSEAKQSKTLGLGIAWPCKENGCLIPHKTLNSPKGFSKPFLKTRWGRSRVSGCKRLGIRSLCSCSCTHRLGHGISVNLQDKYYSLFCNFYLYMNGKVL